MELELRKKYSAKSPGSLMIMGEHAVLYGQPAIVAAINKYLTVELEVENKSNNSGSVIHIYSGINNYNPYKINLASDSNIEIEEPLEYILTVIQYFQKYLVSQNCNYKFTIDSEINHKMGLGSSAAVTIAMIRVIVDYLSDMQIINKEQYNNKQILNSAKQIIASVQGGGSGADLAASLYGGVLYYSADDIGIEYLSNYIPLVTVYSGYKLSTKEVIKKIASSIDTTDSQNYQSQYYQSLFMAIGDLVQQAKNSILNRRWQDLGDLFNRHYGLQEALGVSDTVLSNLVSQLKSEPQIYGAKISGSGLGDCVIAVAHQDFNVVDAKIEQVGTSQLLSDINVAPIVKQKPESKKVHQVVSMQEVVSTILNETKKNRITETDLMYKTGRAFAPSNIALVKYWGKTNTELNIPYTDSLSISLGKLGASTKISVLDKSKHDQDRVFLNNKQVDAKSDFYIRLKNYLDLIRAYQLDGNKPYDCIYQIETDINIPVAAGVASSACGFAALVLAIDDLFDWKLNEKSLSILARLGSGSAARSLWQGFVYWQKGICQDGLDSYAYKFDDIWPELCVGLLIFTDKKKPISSREAMKITYNTSELYKNGWAKQVEKDIKLVKQAIKNKDMQLLGETAENNAMSMHATMLSAKPSICYSTTDTISAMHKIWQLRRDGIKLYFTQDAGPNLKLLFDRKYQDDIKSYFPELIVV